MLCIHFGHTFSRVLIGYTHTKIIQDFNGDQLLECIKELVRTDKDWIPQEHGYSLYIRPTSIATQVQYSRMHLNMIVFGHAYTPPGGLTFGGLRLVFFWGKTTHHGCLRLLGDLRSGVFLVSSPRWLLYVSKGLFGFDFAVMGFFMCASM